MSCEITFSEPAERKEKTIRDKGKTKMKKKARTKIDESESTYSHGLFLVRIVDEIAFNDHPVSRQVQI
jgi:hypothetical protein